MEKVSNCWNAAGARWSTVGHKDLKRDIFLRDVRRDMFLKDLRRDIFKDVRRGMFKVLE